MLQSTTVFSNVSKGVLAKREDLVESFGTDDATAICHKILAEGELQVSDKERKVELDTLFRDVASVLSDKCINPDTRRPYTISMLERALRDVHFSVDPKRSAKAQALEVGWGWGVGWGVAWGGLTLAEPPPPPPPPPHTHHPRRRCHFCKSASPLSARACGCGWWCRWVPRTSWSSCWGGRRQ